MKKYTLSTILFTALFTLPLIAQQPDRWRGLVIEESTPENAISVLGNPKSDKVGDKLFLANAKWFSKDAVKRMRILHYENVEGFSDVKLGFDADKLVLIQLEPKKLTAQAFIASYEDLEFRFANEVMSPSDFKNSRDNTDKPKKMAAWYELVAVNPKVIMLAGVGNATGSVMSGMFGGSDARQFGRSTPGDVKRIQIVSRTLENRDGSNLLK